MEAVTAAIASGWVAWGPRVAEFEARFATAVQAPYAVATSNCTTALHLLALVVAEVGPSDDVVVPSFSFIATTNAPTYVGARPVFADVDAMTGNITADTIEAALTPLTRAVIIVDQGAYRSTTTRSRLCSLPRGIDDHRGCRLWGRVHLSGAPGRCLLPAAYGMVVPSAQAPHHRRGWDAHQLPRRPRGPRSNVARERDERIRLRTAPCGSPAGRGLLRDRLQLPYDGSSGRFGYRATWPSAGDRSLAAASSLPSMLRPSGACPCASLPIRSGARAISSLVGSR